MRQHRLQLPPLLLLLLSLLMAAAPSAAAPPRKGKVFGPCVGMDCLHGVLMHGDAKAGEAHAVEDAERRREELARLSAKEAQPPGQMNQEEFMHGVLMHGDAKAGGAHAHEQPPTVEKKPEQKGPVDQEALMHGLLMHGDADPAHKKRHDAADAAQLKASLGRAGAAGGVPGVERQPSVGDAAAGGSGDGESLLSRWWSFLKLLVTGESQAAASPESSTTAGGDYNLLHDLDAVGNTKSVSELERAAGHSHRDTERVHRERDRREHASRVHIEH